MKKYAILLRGVTPTGKNRVPMAELRAALSDAGLLDVQTYIQSGNVIAKSALAQSSLESFVHEVIFREIGADIAVIAAQTLLSQQLHAVIRRLAATLAMLAGTIATPASTATSDRTACMPCASCTTRGVNPAAVHRPSTCAWKPMPSPAGHETNGSSASIATLTSGASASA